MDVVRIKRHNEGLVVKRYSGYPVSVATYFQGEHRSD